MYSYSVWLISLGAGAAKAAPRSPLRRSFDLIFGGYALIFGIYGVGMS